MKYIKEFENDQSVFNSDLFWAVKYIKISDLKKLLESGADPNIKNSSDCTPLYAALLNRKADDSDTLKMMKILIKYGADTFHKQKYGLTPLCLAADRNKIETLIELIRLGANTKEMSLNSYFIDFLSDDNKKILKERLPDVYKEYETIKDSEKYNL